MKLTVEEKEFLLLALRHASDVWQQMVQDEEFTSPDLGGFEEDDTFTQKTKEQVLAERCSHVEFLKASLPILDKWVGILDSDTNQKCAE